MIFWYRIMPLLGGGVNLSEWFEVHALMMQENCNCTLPAPPPPSLLSPSFSDDIDQSLMLSTMPNPTINCTRPRPPPPKKKKFNSLINYVRITSLHSLWYYNDDDSDKLLWVVVNIRRKQFTDHFTNYIAKRAQVERETWWNVDTGEPALATFQNIVWTNACDVEIRKLVSLKLGISHSSISATAQSFTACIDDFFSLGWRGE